MEELKELVEAMLVSHNASLAYYATYECLSTQQAFERNGHRGAVLALVEVLAKLDSISKATPPAATTEGAE